MKYLIFLIIIFIIIFIIGLYCGLNTIYYTIDSELISASIKIALITDLHSCYYGKNMHTLIEAINKENPDIIVLGGDIFDDKLSDLNTEKFLSNIAEIYPIYYVTGNHECWSGIDKFNTKMAILEKYNIQRLQGNVTKLELNGNIISLCGIDDPDIFHVSEEDNNYKAQLQRISERIDKSTYKILLTHRPELFEEYTQYEFNLVLSGHAHGGQWRIPGILNGLYAPNQGIFPKYAGGYYEIGNTKMIVSRGLARESTLIPRLYNPPELVIVELKNISI